MYDRDRNSAFNEAYHYAQTLLRMRDRNEVAAFIKSVRDQGLEAGRTQSHSEDEWRYVGVDVGDSTGTLASMKFGALVEGPGIIWGWSLVCGEAPPHPATFESVPIGRDGPPLGHISRKFREHLDFCRKQQHPI